MGAQGDGGERGELVVYDNAELAGIDFMRE
jgi:hypothetical protein